MKMSKRAKILLTKTRNESPFFGASMFMSVVFCILMTLLFSYVSISAQSDPDPNSATPILSLPSDFKKPVGSAKPFNIADLKFPTVDFHVSNVDLMKGEGASAFRVYATDEVGRQYRFPIADFRPIKSAASSYVLSIVLKNELNDRKQTVQNSVLYFRVSWRGMISSAIGVDFNNGKPKIVSSAKSFEKVKANGNFTDSGFVGYKYSGDRHRFLEQATFGPTSELDQRIRRIGLRVWLGEQFSSPYPSYSNPYPNLELRSSVKDIGCSIYLPAEEKRVCDRDYYSMYPVQNWFFKEALYGESQLRHRVAWALSQIWVVSGKTTQQASHMVAYHKVLSENAFGNYRVLMKEMTLNPAMGNYLDMARSHAFSPNENFAREILQLFTIGLFRLNQDGTPLLDKTGEKIPTYSQETVNNFTKVFTGWTFCNDGTDSRCRNSRIGTVNFIDPMINFPAAHDGNPKTLLNYPNSIYESIPAGQTGEIDLDQALDNIFTTQMSVRLLDGF